jgi:hypothetical protein
VRYRVGALAAALALSCGGSPGTWQPAPLPQNEKPATHWDARDEDRWVVLACENLVDSSGDLRCEALDQDQFKPDNCASSFGKLRKAATSFRGQLAFRALLVMLADAHTCHEVSMSFQASLHLQYAPSSQVPTTNCARKDIFSPFILSKDEARARRGQNAIHFSDVPSSPAAPIEVCGVKGELAWLTRVTCKDGSQPWGKDFDRAHGARSGSTKLQKLRRCPNQDAPLDVYKVPCPEQTYEIYMDLYECGPGEPF